MKYLHTMVRVRDLDASLRFYCEGLGLRGLARGVVDPQVDLHAAEIGDRQPCGVLQAAGEKLVARLSRARRHEKRHRHGGGGIDRRAARPARANRLAGGDGQRGYGNYDAAQ